MKLEMYKKNCNVTAIELNFEGDGDIINVIGIAEESTDAVAYAAIEDFNANAAKVIIYHAGSSALFS